MSSRIAIVLFLGVAVISRAAPGEAKLLGLIERLDHDEFLVRQHATTDLMKAGETAIPLLVAAVERGSVEQRTRAAEVLHVIQRQRLARGFAELGKRDEKDLSVERGMVLIAQILDPQVTEKSIATKLDEVAAEVRRSLGKDVHPKSLGGAEIISAITAVLRDKYELDGDHETYDHPDNSSVHRAFEDKDGLPIVLSEIAVAVGKRLDVPIVGLPVPGRYMFKYDGSQAPTGKPKRDVIIDAHEDWNVTTPACFSIARCSAVMSE